MIGPIKYEKILLQDDVVRLKHIEQHIDLFLIDVESKSYNIANSALNNILSYRKSYEDLGLIDLYIQHLEEVIKRTPHYNLKVVSIGELYRLCSWNSLFRIGKYTRGKEDVESKKIRRVITNLFYESVNQFYDNTIKGNLFRMAGLGTGGIRIKPENVDESLLIRYLSELVKITEDKEIIDKLMLLSNYEPLKNLINDVVTDIYSNVSSDMKNYITENYYSLRRAKKV